MNDHIPQKHQLHTIYQMIAALGPIASKYAARFALAMLTDEERTEVMSTDMPPGSASAYALAQRNRARTERMRAAKERGKADLAARRGPAAS